MALTPNGCSIEVEILNTENVMNCQIGPFFTRPQSLFDLCQTLPSLTIKNPFNTFCVYAPAEGRMVTMCDANSADQTHTFFQMADSQTTSLAQIPRVISYPDIKSTDGFVPTEIWPGDAGLARVPLLSNFASSADANTNLGILRATGQLIVQDTDGLMRIQPDLSGNGTLDNLGTVAVSSSGGIQSVAFSIAGVYVKTVASAQFRKLNAPGSTLGSTRYPQLLLYDLSATLSVLVSVGWTNTTLRIWFYSINSFDLDPSTLVPFKQFAQALTSTQIVTYVLLSPDETQIVIGIAEYASATQGMLTFRMSALNDGNITLTAICATLLNLGAPVPLLLKWDGFLPNNLLGPAQFFAEVANILISFTLPPSNQLVFSTLVQKGISRVRMTQRKSVGAYADTDQLFINGVLTAAPFPVSSFDDVYAFSADGVWLNVISARTGHFYRRNIASQTWQGAIDALDLLYASAPPRINELVGGAQPFSAWFLGTSISQTMPVIPVLTNFTPSIVLYRSLHQVYQVRATGVDPTTKRLIAVVEQLNLQAFVQNSQNQTEMYNNGVVRVRNIASQAILWDSFTNDQEGEDDIFAILNTNVNYAPEAQLSVSSPNGRYMLLVFAQTVDLVLNPFNAPRFTQWVLASSTIDQAAAGQTEFCFQALNNLDVAPLQFVDKHCACLRSARMARRVFPNILSLDAGTQVTLSNKTPCVLKDCELNPADEYTVSSLTVGSLCVEGIGVCGQFAAHTATNDNLFVTQDCSVNLSPCQSSAQCPAGATCRNGKCVASCSNDAPCRAANPNAVCIQGQCVVLNSNDTGIPIPPNQRPAPNSDSPPLWKVLVCILLGTGILLFLLLLTYFVTKRRVQYTRWKQTVA